MAHYSSSIPQPSLIRSLFSETRYSWIWLIIRLYVGYEWLIAGWMKVTNPSWNQGAIQGFVMGALKKTAGEHPDVTSWYAYFLTHTVLPNASVFAYLVAYGEVLVGIGLILGIFTGIAAFFGFFMNANYLLAGTVSSNPILLLLQIPLILAWRVAGHFGLDRFLLPRLGTPWHKGTFLRGSDT